MQPRPDSRAIRLGALAFGLVAIAIATIAFLAALGYVPSETPFTSVSRAATIVVALIFALAGVSVALLGFGHRAFGMRMAVAAMFAFLLAFNWVAFGPGERRFTRTVSVGSSRGAGVQASELEGRVVFGIVAGLGDLLLLISIMSWVRRRRP